MPAPRRSLRLAISLAAVLLGSLLGSLISRTPTSVAREVNTPAPVGTLAVPQVAPSEVPIGQATATRTPTPINVGNLVWDDLDKDGRRDAGEPGIAGVTVQLWNATKTALLDSDTTDASGSYTVVAPLPGDYRVRVLLPNPTLDLFSPKDQASDDDQLDSDINPSGVNSGFTDIYTFANNLISITTIDAGIIVYRPPTPTRTPTPINVGNLVWNDLNGNGIYEANEPGLAYITVQLWNAAKNDLIDTATTNANGNYTLVAPLPGDYRVRVLAPTGATFSAKDQGANDQVDSDINQSGVNFGFTDIYTFASNLISITTIDAGLTNVPPTPIITTTPTRTPTTTPTTDPLASPTNTATVESLLGDSKLYLPLLTN